MHTHSALASKTSNSPVGPNGASGATYANPSWSSTTPATPMANNALNPAGGSQPHDNMSPYQVINFIIATEGIYPTPN